MQTPFNVVFETYLQKATSDSVPSEAETLRNLLYGSFMDPSADVKRYTEISDQERLIEVLNEYLSDYNTISKTPMQLVLFLYAAEHICRISRVISQPYGNALLVGVGGSGRQSLSKLATHMAEYSLYQVKGDAWRDRKKKYKKKKNSGDDDDDEKRYRTYSL